MIKIDIHNHILPASWPNLKEVRFSYIFLYAIDICFRCATLIDLSGADVDTRNELVYGETLNSVEHLRDWNPGSCIT